MSSSQDRKNKRSTASLSTQSSPRTWKRVRTTSPTDTLDVGPLFGSDVKLHTAVSAPLHFNGQRTLPCLSITHLQSADFIPPDVPTMIVETALRRDNATAGALLRAFPSCANRLYSDGSVTTTLFIIAASRGNTELCQFLVNDFKVDVNFQQHRDGAQLVEDSALMIAIRRGYAPCATYILSLPSVDVDLTFYDTKETALRLAVTRHMPFVASQLCMRNALIRDVPGKMYPIDAKHLRWDDDELSNLRVARYLLLHGYVNIDQKSKVCCFLSLSRVTHFGRTRTTTRRSCAQSPTKRRTSFGCSLNTTLAWT